MAVHTTVKGSEDIMDLPPFKDLFGQYFMMGNIFNPRDVASNGSSVTNEWLTHHYNILTPENNMKPSTLTNARDAATGEITYNFATADRMVNAALASGIKVHGHTLLWHQQIPKWQEALATADKATALNIMKKYITEVVTHFKGKIYSWDVLNEVVPDGGRSEDWTAALRQENPWYKSIGADFVYEAYLAARLADPSVILYYNDYNLDQGGKSGTVYSMVYAVNAKYKQAYPRETRLLIEGIGMQSHHNTNVSVVSIRNSIDRFRQLGVKLSVSELDILGQGWSEFRGSTGQGVELDDVSSVTNRGIMDQARLFGEYMKLYIDNADIIERVALWGVTDDRSWRSGGVPLLFDHNGKAKPGYYTFVGALNAKPAE
jgi:endo-1,4-beta-xylanase